MIKISELLENKIHPLIHGAFMSRIIESKDKHYFAALSSYQKSNKINLEHFDFDSYTNKYVESLNKISNSDNWITINEYKTEFNFCNFDLKGKEKALFIIENDLKITKESFYSKLHYKLMNEAEYIEDEKINDDKRNFIRGFFELRGSIDTGRLLISMDYFYSNKFEIDKALILTNYLSVPYNIINLNFRELQNQFINKINKRNTQIRIQLNWYMNNIGLINDYKFEIVKEIIKIKYKYLNSEYIKNNLVNYIQIPEEKKLNNWNLFIYRITYFSNNIFNKVLSPDEIQKIREELGFDKEITESRFVRNKMLVELVRNTKEDICSGCHNNKNLDDRTFTHKKYKRPYFEIHHNISLKNNITLDHKDNLVKLCPVCHACLKKGVGLDLDQKNIIKNILELDKDVKEYASSYFDIDTSDLNSLIDKIHSCLA